MTDWSLVGGHPAPGSPEGVETVGAAFTRLAGLVDDVRQDLKQTGARSGVGGWQGEAGDAFRKQISALPGELMSISVSYRQGAAAMRTYAVALRRQQVAASRAVGQAEEAAAEVARAERARDEAQAQIHSLDGRLRQARAQRDRAQAQYNAAPDAETRSALSPGLDAARALVRRLEADLRAATAERDRQDRALRNARDRLEDAQADAERVRGSITQAADAAIRALEAAEKEANLPDWIARAKGDAKVWFTTYGPAIAEAFELGVTLFSVAAKLFPPGAPVFLTFAAICGGGAFLVTFGTMLSSPEGVTTEQLLRLGGQALSIAAAVAGVSALAHARKAADAARLAQAAHGTSVAGVAAKTAMDAAVSSQKLATAANALEWVRDGVHVAEGSVRDGWAGGLRAGTGVVIGRGAGWATSHALKASISGLHKNPVTSGLLNDASRAVAESHGTAGIHSSTVTDLVGGPRAIQSMLGVGHIPPGGALPGHNGLPYLDSHALSRVRTDDAFKQVGEFVPEEVGEWLVERFSGSGSESGSGPGSGTGAEDSITLPMNTSDRNEAR